MLLLTSFLLPVFSMYKAPANTPPLSAQQRANCDKFVQQQTQQRQNQMASDAAKGIPALTAYTPEQQKRNAEAAQARKEFVHGLQEQSYHNQTHGHDTGFGHHAHGYTPQVARK